MKINREILREGVVGRVENDKTRKTEKRMIHIFNDAVLITKVRNPSGNFTYKYKEFFELTKKLRVQATDELCKLKLFIF